MIFIVAVLVLIYGYVKSNWNAVALGIVIAAVGAGMSYVCSVSVSGGGGVPNGRLMEQIAYEQEQRAGMQYHSSNPAPEQEFNHAEWLAQQGPVADAPRQAESATSDQKLRSCAMLAKMGIKGDGCPA